MQCSTCFAAVAVLAGIGLFAYGGSVDPPVPPASGDATGLVSPSADWRANLDRLTDIAITDSTTRSFVRACEPAGQCRTSVPPIADWWKIPGSALLPLRRPGTRHGERARLLTPGGRP
ncbi:MAG: hypothetical protein HIU82_12560 [Proteobacteria bacterium]|nr:hypothetical protein [Pseudomonadota bacterium]